MRTLWIVKRCTTTTQISKDQKPFTNWICILQWQLFSVLQLGAVLLLDTRGLFNNVWRVWFLWRMSFIPVTQLESWCRSFKVASSCFLISISSLFLSFRPPSRATLQLWPHFLRHFLPPAPTLLTPGQQNEVSTIQHNCSETWLSSVDPLFFAFLK